MQRYRLSLVFTNILLIERHLDYLLQHLAIPAVYYTPAEVYGVAAGTPVTLRAPSVPTASTHGDVSTLQTPSFCLDNGKGYNIIAFVSKFHTIAGC